MLIVSENEYARVVIHPYKDPYTVRVEKKTSDGWLLYCPLDSRKNCLAYTEAREAFNYLSREIFYHKDMRMTAIANLDRVTLQELKHINKIVERATAIYARHSIPRCEMDIRLDLIATHCNGTPLRLVDLSRADDFNLMHDVSGICVNLDRSTGQLKNEFRPRFCRSERTKLVSAQLAALPHEKARSKRAKVLRVHSKGFAV